MSQAAPPQAGPEGLFLANLELVDRLVAFICRRHALHGDDRDDFASWVRLKLMEDDYRVFRRHRGESSLEAYLTVVVHNLFRDHRNRRWGKWRPSAVARRLGEVAVRLETLMNRDGHGAAEAVRLLRARDPGAPPASELMRLAARLPHRPRRRFVGDEVLDAVPGPERTDGRVLAAERTALLERAEALLTRALEELEDEERTILRLRFEEGMSVAGIARALGLPQRPLYDRIKRNLKRLRAVLEGAGLPREDVARFLTAP